MAARAATRPSVDLWRGILRLPPAIRRTLVTASSPDIYDVVCVGGGPAGLSLLSALRSNPSTRSLRVALIDSQDLSNPRAAGGLEFSNRCSSVTPSSVRFLKATGVWDHVDPTRVQRYHGMEVWDGVSGSKVSFDPLDSSDGGLLASLAQLVPGNRFSESRRKYELSAENGVIATMCENSNLTAALLRRLTALQGVDVFDKTRVESIQLGPEPETEEGLDLSQWPIITLSNERKLAARLLVGADGANSPVRNFADIPSQGWDYNQHGVVATLELDRSLDPEENHLAFQRFLPTGPVALLPLPGNRASLVWSITTPLAHTLKQLQADDFLSILNAAFRLEPVDLDYLLANPATTDLAGDIRWRVQNTPPSRTGLPASLPTIISVQPKSLASFPLRMRHASTYTGHRVALVGDAAHTIHPLAGQGLNLGLADAEALASRLAHGVEHGADIGTCWCLDGYGADRWAANNAVMGVCDKLHKLYSAASGPVVWGRSFGLSLVDRLGPVKGLLMGAAGGGR